MSEERQEQVVRVQEAGPQGLAEAWAQQRGGGGGVGPTQGWGL